MMLEKVVEVKVLETTKLLACTTFEMTQSSGKQLYGWAPFFGSMFDSYYSALQSTNGDLIPDTMTPVHI